MSFRSRLRTDAYIPPELGIIMDGQFVVVLRLLYLDNVGRVFVVPRGYITDFASIPRTLRGMPGFDINGRSRPAAVLHDYLYSMQGKVPIMYSKSFGDPAVVGQTQDLTFSRKECDDLFYEALQSVECPTAKLMYIGVRVGGNGYWNRRAGTTTEGDFVPDTYSYDDPEEHF